MHVSFVNYLISNAERSALKTSDVDDDTRIKNAKMMSNLKNTVRTKSLNLAS